MLIYSKILSKHYDSMSSFAISDWPVGAIQPLSSSLFLSLLRWSRAQWPLIPMTHCSLRIGHNPRWSLVALRTTILSIHAYVQTTACSYPDHHKTPPPLFVPMRFRWSHLSHFRTKQRPACMQVSFSLYHTMICMKDQNSHVSSRCIPSSTHMARNPRLDTGHFKSSFPTGRCAYRPSVTS